MSKQVMVLVRCDWCQEPADEDRPVTQDIAFAWGRKEGEIDLCDTCKVEVDDMLAGLLESVRKPARTINAKKSSQTQPNGDGDRPCTQRGCDKMVKGELGLSVHLSRGHGISGVSRTAGQKTTRTKKRAAPKTAAKKR